MTPVNSYRTQSINPIQIFAITMTIQITQFIIIKFNQINKQWYGSTRSISLVAFEYKMVLKPHIETWIRGLMICVFQLYINLCIIVVLMMIVLVWFYLFVCDCLLWCMFATAFCATRLGFVVTVGAQIGCFYVLF